MPTFAALLLTLSFHSTAHASAAADGEIPPPLVPGSTAAGVTVETPPGWTVERSNSSGFVATQNKGGAKVFVSWAPFQLDATPEVIQGWSTLATWRLQAERFDEVKLESAEPTTVYGYAGAEAVVTGTDGEKGSGAIVQRSVPFAGHVLHISGRAASREAALGVASQWQGAITLAHPPADLSALFGTASASSGLAATLPEGWRRPLPDELERLRPLLANTGHETVDPERCWTAIRPDTEGDASLLLSCEQELAIGVLDSHGQARVDGNIRSALFGPVGAQMAPGELIEGANGSSLLYTMPSPEKYILRLAVTPTGDHAAITWLVGEKKDAEMLNATLLTVVQGATLPSGPAEATVTEWMDYLLWDRDGAMIIGGLGLVVGGVFFARSSARNRRRWEELHAEE